VLQIIATVALALYTAWSLGANDETTAPVVSGRSLGINEAILMGGIVGIMGAVFLGENVQKCIGSELLLKPITIECALITLFSSATWLTLVSYRGYSVSTTHSTLSALIGYGLITVGLSDIDLSKVTVIMVGWLISIPIGFLEAYLLSKVIFHIKHSESKDHEKFERHFSKLLIFSTFLLQFSRWGNDVGNAAGLLYALFDPLISRFICALAMSVGLFVLGRIVVGSVGIRMVRLLPSAAFVAQITSVSIIFPFAYIGIPLSGTHVMISSIIGTGIATKAKVNMQMFKTFNIAWILSFICPGTLAAIIVLVMRLF